MPDKMSDRMPEDLPVTTCINVMVGITRSKVIYVIIPYFCFNIYCMFCVVLFCIVEGSLEVKLPTMNRREQIREEKESEESRCRCAKR